MGWGQHVSEISSKATKTLGFLRRNLAFAPRSMKEVAYKTLVWPKLEYLSIQHPFGALVRNFRLIRLRKFRQPFGELSSIMSVNCCETVLSVNCLDSDSVTDGKYRVQPKYQGQELARTFLVTKTKVNLFKKQQNQM